MRRFLLAAFVLTLLAGTGAPPVAAQTLKPKPPPGKSIAQTLALMGIASTFYAGLRAAKLDSVLNGPAKTPYTVFVPSNAAFVQLKEKGLGLASTTGQGLDQHRTELLLRFHLVPGRYPTEALRPGQSLPTLNVAFPVKVSAQGTRVFVGGTNTAPVELVNAYILCDNGIIHLIDEVLVPFARTKTPALPPAGH